MWRKTSREKAWSQAGSWDNIGDALNRVKESTREESNTNWRSRPRTYKVKGHECQTKGLRI